MKKLILTLVIAVAAIQASAQAYIGFRIGEPYGLNIKSFLNDRSAIDLTIGGNHIIETFTYQSTGIDWGGPTVMFNYVYQTPVRRNSDLHFYIGGGISYKWVQFFKLEVSPLTGKRQEHRISLNLVPGFEYHFGRDGIVLFADIIPNMELTPGFLAVTYDIGAGLRFPLN